MAGLRLGRALRESLRQGYGIADLRADVLAGLVVGVVALPLSMALAIASGVPPQHGLYTAIVAGGLTALLGGSRVQVTGPTAAFVVILAPISARFGLQGLAVATVMAGLILAGMGLSRLGRLVQFIPYPVTTGFTAGIGLTIALLQIEGFLGLSVPPPEGEAGTIERTVAIARSLPTLAPWDLLAGATTLGLLLAWRRLRSRVPAPLIALPAGALVAWLVERFVPGADVLTLAERFGTPEHPAGIPRVLPSFAVPWSLPGPDGQPGAGLSLEMLRTLLPAAFAIAMLGAIESLLSAVVSDGMSGHQHDPDAELLALGIGNVVGPFFGGIAATGAIARTATSVRSGARSPIAAVVHSAFVLSAVLTLAPYLGLLPMASLAGLLLLVAWNMSEARHFVRVIRVAPGSDTAVLLACFGLTVAFDMAIAVAAGIVLAALLFMRRMIEISGARLIGELHPSSDEPLPPGLIVYEIAGPMFFGAAHKATSQLMNVDRKKTSMVLLDLSAVPAVDATGIFNLQSAIDRLESAGIEVALCGLQSQPARALAKAGVVGEGGRVQSYAHVHDAIGVARRRLAHPGPGVASASA